MDTENKKSSTKKKPVAKGKRVEEIEISEEVIDNIEEAVMEFTTKSLEGLDLQYLIDNGFVPKQKIKYNKIIVVLVIILNVLFAAAVLFIFYRTGSEPTELVRMFYAFTSIELLGMAGIKATEIIKKNPKKRSIKKLKGEG